MNKAIRERVDEIVDAFVEGLLIDKYSVAQESPSLMGKIQDFLGDLPEGSGYCFDTISGKVERMEPLPEDYHKARQLIYRLTEAPRRALIGNCLLRRRVIREVGKEERQITKHELAQLCGFSLPTFWNRLSEARKQLGKMIEEEGVLIA